LLKKFLTERNFTFNDNLQGLDSYKYLLQYDRNLYVQQQQDDSSTLQRLYAQTTSLVSYIWGTDDKRRKELFGEQL